MVTGGDSHRPPNDNCYVKALSSERLASSPAIRIYHPRLYEVEKTSIHNKSYLNDQEDEDVLFSGVASGRAGVSCSPYADYTKKE
ncbi:hypothetical protein F2Q70_00016732 [Brassica cretica]|uniref:Uncharacterized protein n=1 Tax=Brassica cretica TaxID=69181 RepID=A0A8S9I6U2_BRACR|nr:hypothetical protein F2Q70_00016732 [Brassica cretica]